MDLICYLPTGWTFNIRPAEAKREWMDKSPDAFAYRCLPLNIANAHGWEVLAPSSFEVIWNGGSNRTDTSVRMIGRHDPAYAPISLFGQGIVTIHMHGIFRTPPGWNLWVGGPPNRPKDAIYPLAGIVETDWSPYTFTMNWQITRAHQWVRFDEGEPICFVFPVQRGLLDTVEPRFVALEKNPELQRQFNEWRESRDKFYKTAGRDPNSNPANSWQKLYYRGVDMSERSPVADHEVKLRLKPFTTGEPPARSRGPGGVSDARQGRVATIDTASEVPQSRVGAVEAAQSATPSVQRVLQDIALSLASGAERSAALDALIAAGVSVTEAARLVETTAAHPIVAAGRAASLALLKRDWLLESMSRQSGLAPAMERVERRVGISSDEFLRRYYASSTPVVLVDETSDWPALSRWTLVYLRSVIDDRVVECAVTRGEGKDVEHSKSMPFHRFADLAETPPSDAPRFVVEAGEDGGTNAEAFEMLRADLGSLDRFLDRTAERRGKRIAVAAAGARSGWNQARANRLIVQVVGRRRTKLVAACDSAKAWTDSNTPRSGGDRMSQEANGPERYRGARVHELILNPGEVLFLPVGWWHCSEMLDFGVTATYSNFKWSNDEGPAYPDD